MSIRGELIKLGAFGLVAVVVFSVLWSTLVNVTTGRDEELHGRLH